MELTGRDGRGAASHPGQSRMCVHKLVDQPIRVDQIDLNVWQGEGGHRCIYSLVRWAVPPSAGINSATAGGSEEAAVPSAGSRNAGSHPSRARIWWCRGKFFVPYPCFFSKKHKGAWKPASCLAYSPQWAAATGFGQEEPQLLFSVQVPHHSSFSRLSPPAQPPRGWLRWMHQSQRQLGSGESFTTSNLISFTRHSQASRPLPPPRLFLLLPIQVTSQQAP